MKLSKPALLATTILTLLPSVQAQWIGAGAGGAGTDFNTSTNWTSGTINGSFVNNTSGATVVLSGDQSLGTNGLTFFNGTTPIQPTVLTLDGTAGGALEKLTIGNTVTLNRSAAISPAPTATWSSGASSITVSSTTGLAVGQLITGGSGIVTGTVITGISGSTVTLSNNTTAAQASAVTMAIASGVILGSNMELSLGNAARTFTGGGTSGATGAITVNSLFTSTGANGGISVGANLILNLVNNGNTFTGPISGNGGTLNFTSIGDFGAASALGAGTAGTAISVNNYTLSFTGSADQTSNRTFNIGNPFGLLANNSPNNSKLTLSGAFANNVNTGTIGIGGTSTGLSEITGQISNGTVTTTVTKNGAGTWKLSGSNTYSGATSIAQGILEISSIKSVGSSDASSLGKVTTAADGTINIGGSGGGTLRYIGTGDTSDRAFTIGSAGSSSSATLINNGSGALVLSGGLISANTAQMQQRSFILDGTNTDTNTFSGNIAFSFAPTTASNNGANAVITKSGAGLWVLGGASSYSYTGTGTAGALSTNVNAGTLRIINANAIAGGISTTGGTSSLSINGGVLELGAGDFTRGLGTTAATVNLQNGGFSAFGGSRAVNLGGASASVTWGAGNFMTAGGAIFQLSSAASNDLIDFQNPISLGSTSTTTRTFQVNNGSAPVDARISGVISQTGGTHTFAKTGAGTLELTNTNSFTGPTTISAGILQISGSINSTSQVNITSGSLLLSGGSEKVAAVPVAITNGTLEFADGNAGGYTETLGSLTLSGTATLDFGKNTAAGNTFIFSGLSAATLSGLNGATIALNVWNWSPGANGTIDDGTSNGTIGDAQDRLLFPSGLTLNAAQLAQITFFSGEGTGWLGTGSAISFGSGIEIVPVPEPSSTALVGSFGLMSLAGYRCVASRRRKRSAARLE